MVFLKRGVVVFFSTQSPPKCPNTRCTDAVALQARPQSSSCSKTLQSRRSFAVFGDHNDGALGVVHAVRTHTPQKCPANQTAYQRSCGYNRTARTTDAPMLRCSDALSGNLPSQRSIAVRPHDQQVSLLLLHRSADGLARFPHS